MRLEVRDYENDDSPAYYNMLAKTMISEGNYGKLILILQERMDAGNLGTHEHAIFHYWIGKAYEISGDARNAFLQYHSLIRVSQFCLENGYTERAHRYIGRCQEDALIADAHTRLAQISSRLGSINKAYEKKTRDQNRSINIRNFFLRLVLGILILSLVYIVLSWRELKRTNKEIRGNIKAIQEANRIKEAYMGQFLSLASNHADALELYRSRLRTLAKRTDFEAIQQELRSDDFINEELANLYEIFDKTFLNLFPDFVEQLNELLRPEEPKLLDLLLLPPERPMILPAKIDDLHVINFVPVRIDIMRFRAGIHHEKLHFIRDQPRLLKELALRAILHGLRQFDRAARIAPKMIIRPLPEEQLSLFILDHDAASALQQRPMPHKLP